MANSKVSERGREGSNGICKIFAENNVRKTRWEEVNGLVKPETKREESKRGREKVY